MRSYMQLNIYIQTYTHKYTYTFIHIPTITYSIIYAYMHLHIHSYAHRYIYSYKREQTLKIHTHTYKRGIVPYNAERVRNYSINILLLIQSQRANRFRLSPEVFDTIEQLKVKIVKSYMSKPFEHLEIDLVGLNFLFNKSEAVYKLRVIDKESRFNFVFPI